MKERVVCIRLVYHHFDINKRKIIHSRRDQKGREGKLGTGVQPNLMTLVLERTQVRTAWVAVLLYIYAKITIDLKSLVADLQTFGVSGEVCAFLGLKSHSMSPLYWFSMGRMTLNSTLVLCTKEM